MLSDVFICNLALAHLGRAPINSMLEKSPAAEAMNLAYEPARLEALNSFPWGFATVWKTGVLLDIDPLPGWSYVYSYPSDALRVWEINRTSKEQKEIPFKVTADPDDLTRKLIHTNEGEAVFVYTVDIADPTMFDWDYVTALSWLLAFKTAMAITKNKQHKDDAQRNWLAFTGMAKARSANESVPDSDITPSYQAVR